MYAKLCLSHFPQKISLPPPIISAALSKYLSNCIITILLLTHPSFLKLSSLPTFMLITQPPLHFTYLVYHYNHSVALHPSFPGMVNHFLISCISLNNSIIPYIHIQCYQILKVLTYSALPSLLIILQHLSFNYIYFYSIPIFSTPIHSYNLYPLTCSFPTNFYPLHSSMVYPHTPSLLFYLFSSLLQQEIYSLLTLLSCFSLSSLNRTPPTSTLASLS